MSALIQRTKKMRRKTRDRTVFRRFEREARGRVGERDILGEKQVAGRSCSRIGDPVGSTGSQRLFRSGVPTIGGELGSSGVSRVAPFVKEAPPSCSRSGQMSNPVGNRLPFYICARAHARTHTRTRSFRPCLLAYLSDSDSRRCRSTIALSLSLSSSLSFFPNAPNAISRDFSKRVFYSSLRNRAASCETRDALDERKKRKEEEKEQKRGRNQRSSVIWIFAACA